MDEYSSTWSDAIRAETDSLDDGAIAPLPDELHRFGTFGGAPWRERSLAWILRLTAVHADDAQKIVSDLRAAFLPLRRDGPNFAVRSND